MFKFFRKKEQGTTIKNFNDLLNYVKAFNISPYTVNVQRMLKQIPENPFISSALERMQQGFYSIDWSVYEENTEGKNEKKDNIVYRSLINPNALMDTDDFLYYCYLYWTIFGEFLIQKIKLYNKYDLWIYSPAEYTINYNNNNILFGIQSIDLSNGKKISGKELENFCYKKMPNLYSKGNGINRVTSLALLHDYYCLISRWNNSILKNINIHVNQGEIVSILGGSGVGKTTLFNLIAGINELQSGTIEIQGDSNFKGKVSYMLQKDLLLEHKTVIQNIILPLLIKKVNKKEAEAEAIKNLKLFNLYDYKDKYPSELSGGMRQRVALLRTYMFKEELFLLDEPFSALDAITKISLHSWYLDICKKFNLTTLLITHDIDEAIDLSDRIYIIKNKPGEIISEIIVQLKDENVDEQKLKYKKEILKLLGL